MIRAVPESHFDLISLHQEKIILAYAFDAEVHNTFLAALPMNRVFAELQTSNFSLL